MQKRKTNSLPPILFNSRIYANVILKYINIMNNYIYNVKV